MIMTPMTPKQGFALFCLTKLDVRPLKLTIEEAGKYIAKAKSSGADREELKAALRDTFQDLAAGNAIRPINVSAPATPEVAPPSWEDIYNTADQAGRQAAEAHKPTPMVVQQHASPLNDNSPVVQSWVVDGGVCGFAWVHLSKANTSFANWCRRKKLGHKSYYGGWDISCGAYGQSMEKKEKYCAAFANELSRHRISCYMESRMD